MVTDRQTSRPTDRPTDIATYRAAITAKKLANLNTYLCAFICSSSATLVTSPNSKLRTIRMKIYWWFFLFQKFIKKGSKPQYIFVCLYLFIISNNSNIAKFKIKNEMDENILVNFLFQKCIEKKVTAKLSKYLCAFIFPSSATTVTSPSSKLWLWIIK